MTETRKAFHEELDELNAQVGELAAVVLHAIEKGTSAFLIGDLNGAEEVINGDRNVDELTWAIEKHAFQLLARQQPMAVDLRILVTIMRVIHEIERVGDNVVNVAKATRRLHPHVLDPHARLLVEQMGDQAVLQLQTAAEAFAQRDCGRAAALSDMDDVMDDLQKDLFHWIFGAHADDEFIQQAVQLSLVGRYYERIADHAVNFGERVAFMVTGSMIDSE